MASRKEKNDILEQGCQTYETISSGLRHPIGKKNIFWKKNILKNISTFSKKKSSVIQISRAPNKELE